MSGNGSSKTKGSTTVGRPKAITVHRQNVAGFTGPAGRMKTVGSIKVGRNKKTK